MLGLAILLSPPLTSEESHPPLEPREGAFYICYILKSLFHICPCPPDPSFHITYTIYYNTKSKGRQADQEASEETTDNISTPAPKALASVGAIKSHLVSKKYDLPDKPINRINHASFLLVSIKINEFSKHPPSVEDLKGN